MILYHDLQHYCSPHVRESTKIPDPSFWILDSNPLDSGFQPSGFWIPYQSSGFRIPKPLWILDSQSLDSGFQQQKLAGFRISDSLTWGDTVVLEITWMNEVIVFRGEKIVVSLSLMPESNTKTRST